MHKLQNSWKVYSVGIQTNRVKRILYLELEKTILILSYEIWSGSKSLKLQVMWRAKRNRRFQEIAIQGLPSDSGDGALICWYRGVSSLDDQRVAGVEISGACNKIRYHEGRIKSWSCKVDLVLHI